MADQTSIKREATARVSAPPSNGSGAPRGGNGVVGSIADFGSDVATLLELQTQLAAADLKETTDRAAVPLAVVVAALFVALAALVVGLLGIADLVELIFKVSAGTAKLITAAFAFVVVGVLVHWALRSVSSIQEPLRRSREELIRNFSWLKTVMVYSGRSYPSRKL